MSKLGNMDTPIFWAEGHPGKLDRNAWMIEICGECERPVVLTWEDLLKLPFSKVSARLTSVTRWSVSGEWGGILISDLLTHVGVKDKCKYIRFWSVGMVYDTSIPIEIAKKEKSIITWEFDSELLDENYGGPVRAMIPYLWGYKSAKSIVKIELMNHYQSGYWELRGYTDSGKIEAGLCRDINDEGKIKKIPEGEVIHFID